jgi:transcriptional regulator with XRE-family HTH domain
MGAQGVGTPGGAKLRALRERRGKTQLWVEFEAELGTGYLQRVESGKVAQPERPTLERVLNALGAR